MSFGPKAILRNSGGCAEQVRPASTSLPPPNRDNGTVLSADEFRNNARLRYNLAPLDMPQHCDGCGSKMTVEHALSCRVGGLVHIRHDDVADEFRSLCCQAFSPGRVQREPRIHSGVSRRVRVEAAADDVTISAANTNNHGSRDPTTTPPTQQQRQLTQQQQRQKQRQPQPHTKTPVSEERGDASCYGFWDRGREAIFDVRITDTEARSHRNKDPEKVLAQQEKEKKDKYLHVCHEQRKDFSPLVYSVDGMAGREAKHAERRLAYHLSRKWQKPYSQLVHYVRVRIGLSIARANTLLIRGSRDRRGSVRPNITDGTALHAWQTWQER